MDDGHGGILRIVLLLSSLTTDWVKTHNRVRWWPTLDKMELICEVVGMKRLDM